MSWRRPPLKLLGALRGEGALVWAGRAIPATYELDVFEHGSTRTGSGRAEGDFCALLEQPADEVTRPCNSRLRLHDGREIEIEIVSVDPAAIEFDARGRSSGLPA